DDVDAVGLVDQHLGPIPPNEAALLERQAARPGRAAVGRAGVVEAPALARALGPDRVDDALGVDRDVGVVALGRAGQPDRGSPGRELLAAVAGDDGVPEIFLA